MTCPAHTHNRTSYRVGVCRCDTGRDGRRLYDKRRKEHRAPVLRIPVLGYRRKLQALMAAGWSQAGMGASVGMSARQLRRIMVDAKWVSPTVAARLDHLWATLSDEDGPATRSSQFATRMGWAPPWAWDGCDMDDPHARPHLELPPVVDEVLIQRVMDGKASYRDLTPDERLDAYREAVRVGWSGIKIQQVFHISGSIYLGLKKAA